jgi:Cys-rich protein (TIGR01571 family)
MSMGLPGIDSSLGSIYGCTDDPQMCCFGLFCPCFLFGQVSPGARSRLPGQRTCHARQPYLRQCQ